MPGAAAAAAGSRYRFSGGSRFYIPSVNYSLSLSLCGADVERRGGRFLGSGERGYTRYYGYLRS